MQNKQTQSAEWAPSGAGGGLSEQRRGQGRVCTLSWCHIKVWMEGKGLLSSSIFSEQKGDIDFCDSSGWKSSSRNRKGGWEGRALWLIPQTNLTTFNRSFSVDIQRNVWFCSSIWWGPHSLCHQPHTEPAHLILRTHAAPAWAETSILPPLLDSPSTSSAPGYGRARRNDADQRHGSQQQDLPVQAGAAGRIGSGEVQSGAALCQRPVPRIPGEHHRRYVRLWCLDLQKTTTRKY